MRFFKNKYFLSITATAIVLAFYFYPTKTNIDRLPAEMNSAQPKVELGESWNLEDQHHSNQILTIIEDSLDKSTNGGNLMKRDAHPKHHGCVQAHVTIDTSALPKDQQVGVFSKSAPEKYDAWIRFSNGNPNADKADSDGDVRGMAMKLMNVPGSESGSQDFLMMNSKSFFIKDSKEYADFMKATEGNVSLLWFLATHSRTRQVIHKAQGMKVGNPLHIDYFSATPYKLGNKIMKYSARTCTPLASRDTVPKKPGHDFLKDRLAATLESSEACFDFYVQVSSNSAKTPLENPTVEWDETVAPFIKVARITIPKQTGVASPEQRRFCENLSFDPWHTLSEQRPLGAINRVRLQVYSAISKKRHEYNKMPQLEPQTLEACSGKTEVLCR